MKVYNNIEILQINFDGTTDRIYWPQNSKIKGKKIDTLGFFWNSLPYKTVLSPLDGTPLVTDNFAGQIYCDIVNDQKEVLQHNIPITANHILLHGTVDVNSVIDLEMCNIRYVGDVADVAGKSLLIYAFYDTIEVDDDLLTSQPYQSVTINIPVAGSEPIQLSNYIDDYILANGKTIKRIGGRGTQYFLDVQDFGGRSFRFLPGQRLEQPNVYGSISNHQWLNPVYLNDYNIDFENSYVYPTGGVNNIELTFYY